MHHRPETVESLFLAFRLTGDPKYRDYGWAIFQAIEKHCRIPTGGYASIKNVDEIPVEHDDKMETFLMVCDVPCPSHIIMSHLFVSSERNIKVSVFTLYGFKRASSQW